MVFLVLCHPKTPKISYPELTVVWFLSNKTSTRAGGCFCLGLILWGCGVTLPPVTLSTSPQGAGGIIPEIEGLAGGGERQALERQAAVGIDKTDYRDCIAIFQGQAQAGNVAGVAQFSRN
ncbi:MAG: hypothetical protein IPN59_13250 [Holophaga sp.]|nr:hypothetical protein [Holophaga sp.]